MIFVWVVVIIVSVGAIVWGEETFAEHLGAAAVRLRVSMFALSLPFATKVRSYALLAVPLAVIATGCLWHGAVGQLEGAVLVALYIFYVAVIWIWEQKPPALGETEEHEYATI